MSCFADYFPVTKEQKEDILSQYGKTQDSIKEDVEIITEWLKKQAHIPKIEDEFFYETLLLRNKFRIEKAKIKIDNYFTSKHSFADFYETLDPCNERIVEASKYHYVACMPELTPKNERILFIAKDLPTDDLYDFKSFVQILTMHLETQILYDFTDSLVVIMDASKNSLSQMSKFEIPFFAKFIKLYLDAFSGRLKILHIVNATPVSEILVKALKQLLTKKIGDRITSHPKGEDILKYFPKDCLPNELSGTAGSAKEISMNFMKSLQKNRDYILKRNKCKTNEALRTGRPHMEVNLYGVEGTFRKITLD